MSRNRAFALRSALLALLLAAPFVLDSCTARSGGESSSDRTYEVLFDSAAEPTSSSMSAGFPMSARWKGDPGASFPLSELGPYVVADSDRAGPRRALLGAWTPTDEGFRFTPRYALRPGRRYELRKGDESLFDFLVPDPRPEVPTRLVALHPNDAELPENLLKFYLYFSAPMSRGGVYDHVRLEREDGTEVLSAFLELNQELWDPGLRRLTLLLDPGRVKSDLVPRQTEGPVLEAGRRYRLRIGRGLVDARGLPLEREIVHEFVAGSADRRQPDPASFELERPAAGSTDPLIVRFDEALDHAMLERVLRVVHVSGAVYEGTGTVADDARSWSFVPSTPWRAGAHELEFDRALEDLAGNSIERPFEVDLFDRIDVDARPKLAVLPFTLVGER